MAMLSPAGPVPTIQISPSIWVSLRRLRASVYIEESLGDVYRLLQGIHGALTGFGDGEHPAVDGDDPACREVLPDFAAKLVGEAGVVGKAGSQQVAQRRPLRLVGY